MLSPWPLSPSLCCTQLGEQTQVPSRAPVPPSCPPALQGAPCPLAVLLGIGHLRPFSLLLICNEERMMGQRQSGPGPGIELNQLPVGLRDGRGWEGGHSSPSLG